jgi:hypothetical protein
MAKEEMQKKRDEREQRWKEQCEKMGETCLFSVTVREFHVYLGSFSELVNISNKLKYHVEPDEEMGGEQTIYITLKEIYEQVKAMYSRVNCIDGKTYTPIITVFDESPMRSTIYQCGNYGEGCWVKLGEIQGYA